MKRIFTFLTAICCSILMLQAETIKLNATSFAYKYQNEYGYWTDWTDWEDCRILVVINTETDRINIYSNSHQEYDVYDYTPEYSDDKGGRTTTFKCVDADGDRCEIRLRQQRDGQFQLYIDYSNIMWVYTIESR